MNSSDQAPSNEGATGYRHAAYARALTEFGSPRLLPASGGWLLQRPIDGSDAVDAMAPYPLFCCEHWSRLPADLEALASELVSVALVADPFGGHSLDDLRRWFGDVVVPFKPHYVVNLPGWRPQDVSAHHRRNARRALRQVELERCPEPLAYLDTWNQLYEGLVSHHNITGIRRFSRQSFSHQLQVPGIVAFRADYEGETVAMLLWYVMGDVAYYHLGASSATGYRLGSSFALFWEAIHYFAREGLCWLNLGGGAGVAAAKEDGLSRFKHGWATGTRPAYFCGRILNPALYERLARKGQRVRSAYFPAYRQGEFQ